MSFILVALKKSEHERQRQTMPGLVETGIVRPRPRFPVWALVLGALLGVNLVVLLFVVTRGWLASPAPRPTVAAESAEVPPGPHAERPRATKGDRPFSPLDAAPVYAPEVPVPPDSDEAADRSAAAPGRTARHRDAGATAPSERTESSARVAAGPVLNEGDYKANDEEVLPSINEINLTGAQALPELHLDVHVFATKPAERFVFINMRKYHEGGTLQEGPTVERIRRDGVILNYNGLRFLLPRQ